MDHPDLDRLAAGKYLSLTTFRKDGTAVATPVWVARDGDHLFVMTDPASGKVKRLRNSGRVRVAPCDMRGTVTGDAVDGTARLLDDEGSELTRTLIARKYRLMYRLIGLRYAITRRRPAHVGIRISIP